MSPSAWQCWGLHTPNSLQSRIAELHPNDWGFWGGHTSGRGAALPSASYTLWMEMQRFFLADPFMFTITGIVLHFCVLEGPAVILHQCKIAKPTK